VDFLGLAKDRRPKADDWLADDRRPKADDQLGPKSSYLNALAANAASSVGLPVGAQTCWFHCLFKSFA
jgi:hypothetical protein